MSTTMSPSEAAVVDKAAADITPGAPSPAQLVLLGGFQLRCLGEDVNLLLSGQRLLAFLALHDRPVLRSYVAGNLWPDSDDERAAANLRSALWRIRRPGFTLVESVGSHLRVSPAVGVDVRELVTQARNLIDRADQAADSDLEISILQGELLPDWYDDWVELERERIRQLRLHALEAACRLLARRARYADAVEAGLAAVRAEPLRESAHAALIAAYLSEGNRSEAIRHYRRYRGLLWEELQVEPSDRLRSLAVGTVTLP